MWLALRHLGPKLKRSDRENLRAKKELNATNSKKRKVNP
jgi:hypothetical protein